MSSVCAAQIECATFVCERATFRTFVTLRLSIVSWPSTDIYTYIREGPNPLLLLLSLEPTIDTRVQGTMTLPILMYLAVVVVVAVTSVTRASRPRGAVAALRVATLRPSGHFQSSEITDNSVYHSVVTSSVRPPRPWRYRKQYAFLRKRKKTITFSAFALDVWREALHHRYTRVVSRV